LAANEGIGSVPNSVTGPVHKTLVVSAVLSIAGTVSAFSELGSFIDLCVVSQVLNHPSVAVCGRTGGSRQ
jgi:hypothetical protein